MSACPAKFFGQNYAATDAEAEGHDRAYSRAVGGTWALASSSKDDGTWRGSRKGAGRREDACKEASLQIITEQDSNWVESVESKVRGS